MVSLNENRVVHTRLKNRLRKRCDETCTICLYGFCKSSKDHVKVLKCGHRFHKSCINGWLKYNVECPLCREPTVNKNISSDSEWNSILKSRREFMEKYPPYDGYRWLKRVYDKWELQEKLRIYLEVQDTSDYIENT